jgi:hypothetical protein
MKILVWVNLAVALLLELVAVCAVGDWGFHAVAAEPWPWVLGTGVPLLFALAWSRWAAPRSSHRLQSWGLVAFKVAAFFLTVLALAGLGLEQVGGVFGVVASLNLYFSHRWRVLESLALG